MGVRNMKVKSFAVSFAVAYILEPCLCANEREVTQNALSARKSLLPFR
jgi:hypothetical protein